MRNRFYFAIKPLIPVRLRTKLRRWHAQRSLEDARDLWPIDPAAGTTPPDWKGWPDGKQFGVLLTHDVEGPVGYNNSLNLAKFEEDHGFRSSFNFVPEAGYTVAPEIRDDLARRGFEVGVHDLHHDGRLYASRSAFRRNAERINRYIREWGAVGFRSAFMLHKLDWLHDLEIEYDASTFDTDPIEPQPDAASTIFPFWVPTPEPITAGRDTSRAHTGSSSRKGYLELPYTLPQDSTLFLFLGHQNIDLWKRKVDWLVERGGMVLLNLHPDYSLFPGQSTGRVTYPVAFYGELLRYISEKYRGAYWHGLPRDLARHIRKTYPSGGPRRPRHQCMLSYSFFERDNRVNRYAKVLAGRGDIVDVLSIQEESSKPAPELREPRIQVHHIQTRQRDERHPIHFLKRILAFTWRSHKRLSQLQKLRNYDVIHVHNVPDFIIFAATFPRLRGARLILDLHDLLPEFYQSKFHCAPDSLVAKALRLCERICCRFAHHVIVSNHIWREKVALRSADPDRCSAFVNHVDDELFKPRRGQSPNRPLIAIFPGGLHHHQGLHVAIQAFAALKDSEPPVELHIVGDGPCREELIALAEKLGATDRIRFFPPVALSKIPILLAGADIGVVPKLADGFGNEAYSTKIMEFMAAGLPVVASRTKIDEYYFGNGCVHFFESGNPDDLVRALKQVMQDSALRERLVQSGLEYSRRENWSQKSKEYIDIVDGLIDERMRRDAALPIA